MFKFDFSVLSSCFQVKIGSFERYLEFEVVKYDLTSKFWKENPVCRFLKWIQT